MKIKSKIFTAMMIFNFILFPTISFSESTLDKSKVDISIEQGPKTDETGGGYEYDLGKPVKIKTLPQTGEIVGSFLIYLFGCSLILFIFNILIFRIYFNLEYGGS